MIELLSSRLFQDKGLMIIEGDPLFENTSYTLFFLAVLARRPFPQEIDP